MNLRLSTVVPVGLALALIAGMIVALALSRPDDDGPAERADAETSPTATATAPPTATATRVPPSPTPTRTQQPTAVPAQATPPGSSAAQAVPELSQLRIVDITVVENPAGIPADFPPGMPLEFLVGIRRDRQPQVAEFFIVPPFPFVQMTGSAVIGSGFSEDGGSGKATGTGSFDGRRANFSFEFQVDARDLRGTLTISDAAAGTTLLVLTWDGETF